MDAIRWPGLDARLRGRRITDLFYDSEHGHVVIQLDGMTVYITAGRSGVHVICDELAPYETIPPTPLP